MLLSVSTGRIDASTLQNHFPRQGSPEKRGEADSRTFHSRVLPFVRLLFPFIFANGRKIGTQWTGDIIGTPIVPRSFSIARAVSYSDIDVYANHCGTTLWRITGKISLKATPLPVYRYANISLDRYQLFPLR